MIAVGLVSIARSRATSGRAGRDKEAEVESDSMLMLAEARQADFRAEVEQYRSGRQQAALVPTVSELVVAAARVLGHAWGDQLARASRSDCGCGH